MLLICIAKLSERRVPGLRVDRVFIVGEKSLWCPGVSAGHGGRRGPSLDSRRPFLLEPRVQELDCILPTNSDSQQEKTREDGGNAEGDGRSELIVGHGRRLIGASRAISPFGTFQPPLRVLWRTEGCYRLNTARRGLSARGRSSPMRPSCRRVPGWRLRVRGDATCCGTAGGGCSA